MIADMFVFAAMAFFYVPYQPQNASDATVRSDTDTNEEKAILNGKPNKEELNGLSTEEKGAVNEGFKEEDTKF